MALQNTFRLAISDDFFDAYSRLPRNAQGKVSEFINRFRQDPTRPGLNYEPIHDSRDKRMKSVRVDQAHRAIVLKPDSGNVYILLWIDKHDNAYTWARRKVCRINEVSGALQIIDVEDVEATTERLEQINQEQIQQPGRFDSLEDKQLMQLGVPEILLPAVRQITTDEGVEQLLPHLPREASDALLMLASGYELDEVLRQLEKPKEVQPVDLEDLEAALQNDDSLSRFLVLTDDTELEEMLAAPLEKWRVFLHPTQRKLVERDWNGAVRVLGGAGTGKTVVAMHRAKWLVQNRFTDSNDRILFTTFTRNLAVDIEANLKSICSTEQMRRIRVANLDAWVAEFLRHEGAETRIVYDGETEDLWRQAYTTAPVELGLPLSFYQEEWQTVVLNQGCQTLRDYLVARRTGRGTRLSRQQRQMIWSMFEEYRNLLREKGLREPEDAMRDAAQILAAKGTASLPFRGVIVDEAQDMSEAAFTLLRAIVGDAAPNDLFIVGDPHQRIYGKVATLGRCGIDIRGRSRKLRLNYRTTDEIRRWATQVLEGMNVDDLDGGSDSLKDYRSLMHGDDPVIKGFTRFDDELTYLKQLLSSIQTTDQTFSGICLVFRTAPLMEQYETALKNLEFPVKRIRRNEPDNPLEEGIRISTMHRIKGLQFNYVILPSLNTDNLPLKIGLENCADEASQARFVDGERCLLHVAATRAKKQVLITYCGKPSQLLPTVQ
jgi:superfamily I DNA/RNA helicase